MNSSFEKGCLLRQSLIGAGEPSEQAALVRNAIPNALRKQLVDAGYCLLQNWQRPWARSVQDWLGPRLYFSHARNFDPSVRYSTIVCSRIGRNGVKLPNWPQLLESALKHCQRNGNLLLQIPGTTLAESTQEFASRAKIPTVTLQQAKANCRIAEWLDTLAERIDRNRFDPRDQLLVSPTLRTGSPGETESPLKAAAFRDAVAIGLADSVHAISIRTGGTLENLIRLRLHDPSFPVASVFLCTSDSPNHSLSSKLNSGAIGWYVFPNSETEEKATNVSPEHVPCIQQLCCRLPESWRDRPKSDSRWLTHCTRANPGAYPGENAAKYHDRLLIEGKLSNLHPLETLQQIASSKRVLGSTTLTRGKHNCVSFSAVPLFALLRQRTFQSHLGRWDFEPYGLCIKRSELVAKGCRSVLYGEQNDYEQLAARDRPFFQARGQGGRWIQEQEWRILDDLDLTALPNEAIRLFVRTQNEANRLSREVCWPVFWVE